MADIFSLFSKSKMNSFAQSGARPERKTDEVKIDDWQKTDMRQRAAAEEEEKPQDLLSRIDDFRERAKQLQRLMQDQQQQADDLQNVVQERSREAEDLAEVIEERKAAASGVTEEVCRRLDDIVSVFSQQMDAAEELMQEGLQNQTQTQEKGLLQLQDQVAAAAEESEQKLAEATEEFGKKLDSFTEQFGGLSEQIHQDNVQCYRNNADLLKEMQQKLDELPAVEAQAKAAKRSARIAVVFAVLDFVGIVGFGLSLLLWTLGVW